MILKKLNKNNNLVKKRKSMKKTMNAGSIQSIVTKIRDYMFTKPNTVQPLDENFIINTYFTKETKRFILKNYPDMYNDDKWNTELLSRFINVYNSFFTRFYFRVLFMDMSRIEIEYNWPDEKPHDILDDNYVAFLLNKSGFIHTPPNILDIIHDLYHKDDADCGIQREDKYYKKYDETIGKGGFGTLFECTKTKVIKFINPISIETNSPNKQHSLNGYMPIRNIVSFLNEIIILIT